MKNIILTIVFSLSFSVFGSTSAVILKENITYKISADKKITKHVYQKVKLLTPASYGSFGEWFYTFNPSFQKVNILKSRTYKKDNTFVDTPENGILVQSPRLTQNAFDFSHYREYMVSHIGLEPDCIIEFEYEIIDLKPHQTYIFEKMGGSFPVKEKTVKIEGSYNRMYYSKSVKKEGNLFKVKGLPFYIESYGYSDFDSIPYVIVEFGNTAEKVKKLFKLSGNDNLKNALSVLKINESDLKYQIVEKVKSFVNGSLVNVNLSIESTGYERRTIESIVKSGFGTNYEKAFIASTVLNKFQINNTILLVFEKNPENFIINPQFLVTTEDYGSLLPNVYGYSNKTVLSFDNKVQKLSRNMEVSVNIDAEENFKSVIEGNIYVEGTNLAGKINSSYCNFVNKGKVKNSKNRIINKNKQFFSGNYILKIDNGKVELNEKPFHLLNLKNLFDSLLYANSINIEENLKIHLHLKVKFNKNIEGIFKKPLNVANKYGKCSVKWEVAGKELVFKESLTLNKGKIMAEDYKYLREIIGPLFDKSYQFSMLNRK